MSSVDAEGHLDASPVAHGESDAIEPSSDLVAQLAGQRLALRLSRLQEAEVAGRLALIREQQSTFVLTARRGLRHLYRLTRPTTEAVATLAHRSETESGGVGEEDELSVGDQDDDSLVDETYLNHTARGELQHRMVYDGFGGSHIPTIVAEVELTGSPQRRLETAAARRLAAERADAERVAQQFAAAERRREQSYLRRAATVVQRSTRPLRRGVERTVLLAEEERQREELQATLRVKHEALDERRRVAGLRDRAATTVIHSLDVQTRRRINAAKQHEAQAEKRLWQRADRSARGAEEFRRGVDAEMRHVVQSRRRAGRDLQRLFEEGHRDRAAYLSAAAHAAEAAHQRAMVQPAAVHIAYPRDVAAAAAASTPSQRDTRREGDRRADGESSVVSSPMDDQTYARLCGFKHSFVTAPTKEYSVYEAEERQAEDRATARSNMSQRTWKVLRSVDPESQEALLRAYADAQHRARVPSTAPSAVKWR